VAQSITIEKGQHLTLLVRSVEETPSKNPAWDSRWKVSGAANGGVEVATYIGNKAMTQQLGRKGMDSPDALVGKNWTLERTAEGYFNLIQGGGKTKTEHVAVEASAPAKPKAMPFDEPVDEEAAEAMAEKLEAIRDEKRRRVSEDLMWAFSLADSMVAAALANREVEYSVDAMRSVVALAATIHISYKEAR
jgi:hypothetical protein